MSRVRSPEDPTESNIYERAESRALEEQMGKAGLPTGLVGRSN